MVKSSLILNKVQYEYLEMLLKYQEVLSDQGITTKTITIFLDEVSIFWLKRLEIIQFELHRLTSKHQCFLLSGAMYLGIKEYEHYYFKAFGDFHIINDPLLKIDNFIRNSNRVNIQETMRIFRNAYNDTVELLLRFPNYFLILPIEQIVWKDREERKHLIDRFFWRFISRAFNIEFMNSQEFCAKYDSYEAIEEEIDAHVMRYLIFNDFGDITKSLENRIKTYFENQPIISPMSKEMSQSQTFLLLTYNQISQIIDILLICTAIQVIPFIRCNVTFNYLVLLMNIFINDSTLRSMLEKTIIFYVFYKSTDVKLFKEMEFEEYCDKLNQNNLINDILSKIRSLDIDIFKEGLKDAEKIIKEEFMAVLRTPN